MGARTLSAWLLILALCVLLYRPRILKKIPREICKKFPGDAHTRKKYMGEKYAQEEFLGEESLGEKSVQEEFLGEESLGEKYMGEMYVQEEFLGEESLGEKTPFGITLSKMGDPGVPLNPFLDKI